MRKLAYIFGIALFFSGCGGGSFILNVSYDPIDPPNKIFTLKAYSLKILQRKIKNSKKKSIFEIYSTRDQII